jgi:hypothetical protein
VGDARLLLQKKVVVLGIVEGLLLVGSANRRTASNDSQKEISSIPRCLPGLFSGRARPGARSRPVVGKTGALEKSGVRVRLRRRSATAPDSRDHLRPPAADIRGPGGEGASSAGGLAAAEARERAVMISATAPTITRAATSILVVIASPATAAPSSTATIGLTYA